MTRRGKRVAVAALLGALLASGGGVSAAAAQGLRAPGWAVASGAGRPQGPVLRHEPIFGVGPHTLYRGGLALELELETEGDEWTVPVHVAYGVTETVTLTADAGRVVLTVDGLACPFCAYGLEKKLEALEATGRIDIGLNAGNVYLELKRGKTVPDEELARIVKDAGFALRGIEHIRAGGSGR